MSQELLDELERLRGIVETVTEHINQRPAYINALKNCHEENDHDYYRWTGGAEARRQLARDLGWTVPHEWGDKTGPKEPTT